MIHFPPIRTTRLTVQLRELTLREAVDLAAMPPERDEAFTSALLKRVVESAQAPNGDPERWTVQERTFVKAHYMACAADEGGNFSVGEGRFLDYLTPEPDAAPDAVDVGEACGDQWRAKQLTGAEAVLMEEFCKTRLDWVTADIAARMSVVGEDEERPDPIARPAEFTAWLSERMGVIQAMSESDFDELFLAYRRGLNALHHLFVLEFDAEGHIVMPNTKEGGAELAPARFLASVCIGRVAHILGA